MAGRVDELFLLSRLVPYNMVVSSHTLRYCPWYYASYTECHGREVDEEAAADEAFIQKANTWSLAFRRSALMRDIVLTSVDTLVLGSHTNKRGSTAEDPRLLQWSLDASVHHRY